MSAGPVVVLGDAQDAPVGLLLDALQAEGIEHQHLAQQRFDEQVFDGPVQGLYLRPLDAARLLAQEPERASACADWTQRWCDLAEALPGRVANRPSAMASNGSKPFQSQCLMALGLAVPPMLITSEPDEVLAFERAHGPLIYKSASGVRSIVRPFDEAARARLPALRHCPAMFQRRLTGTNVRVHVVGHEAFATEIDNDGLDYRYARTEQCTTTLSATQLDPDTRWRCIRAAHEMGLPFAGLDLMRADDGLTYCFEVNPSPGYSWYEDSTGQPISRALARWLGGVDD